MKRTVSLRRENRIFSKECTIVSCFKNFGKDNDVVRQDMAWFHFFIRDSFTSLK